MPAIAIVINIYLMFRLSILTLVRFTIWMTIGNNVHSLIHFTLKLNI